MSDNTSQGGVNPFLNACVVGMLNTLRECAPETFLTDLVRDGAWIQRNGPTAFYWVVYPHGTHLTTDQKLALSLIEDFRREGYRFAVRYFDSYGNMTRTYDPCSGVGDGANHALCSHD